MCAGAPLHIFSGGEFEKKGSDLWKRPSGKFPDLLSQGRWYRVLPLPSVFSLQPGAEVLSLVAVSGPLQPYLAQALGAPDVQHCHENKVSWQPAFERSSQTLHDLFSLNLSSASRREVRMATGTSSCGAVLLHCPQTFVQLWT